MDEKDETRSELEGDSLFKEFFDINLSLGNEQLLDMAPAVSDDLTTPTGPQHLSEPYLLQSLQENEANINVNPGAFLGTTFTNQLGHSTTTNEGQLTEYSEIDHGGFVFYLDPIELTPTIQFELDAVTLPHPTEPTPVIISATPRKRGRPKGEGTGPRAKKRKKWENFDQVNPENNSKKTTDAYNAHVNREKQKNVMGELVNKVSQLESNAASDQSSIQQLTKELEDARQKIVSLENQLTERDRSQNFLGQPSASESLPIYMGEIGNDTAIAINDPAAGDIDALFPSLVDVEDSFNFLGKLN